jgi:hypothetical protein
MFTRRRTGAVDFHFVSATTPSPSAVAAGTHHAGEPDAASPADLTERASPDLAERAFAADLAARVEQLEAQLQALRMSTLAERRFVLDGESHAYHVAVGNRTWENERAVEVPVVWSALQRRGTSAGVLEVGHVLGHYFPTSHPVLDKYEHDPLVTWNEDVVDFHPPFAPELILSISTLEHAGHSERPHDPDKFHAALAAVAGWLAPGGRLLFTVPLGYNPAVREYLDAPDPARTVRCMRRTTLDNLWVQAPYEQVREARYDRPFPCANAVAFVEVARALAEPAGAEGRG